MYEAPDKVFKFVLETFERELDLSTTSLTSAYRRRELVDARRVFYKILRDTFGLSYVAIGSLFSKDHSTVICSMNRHDALYNRDKGYTDLFNVILSDVERRKKANRINPMKDGRLKLKTLHSNEREVYDVILACFASKLESSDFVRNSPIMNEHLVYHGQPMLVTMALAKEIVSSDEKRYVTDLMKKNTDPVLSLLNAPVDRYYFNYAKGEFSIANDALESFNSALSLFPCVDVGLIYVQLAP